VDNTVPIVLSEGTDSLKGAALAKHCQSGSTTAATAAAVAGGQLNPHRIRPKFRQALHPVTPSSDASAFLDANAMFIESAYDADLPPLNITPDDHKLTYSNALKGPSIEDWQKANAAEFVKHIDTTKTIHPIHFATFQ